MVPNVLPQRCRVKRKATAHVGDRFKLSIKFDSNSNVSGLTGSNPWKNEPAMPTLGLFSVRVPSGPR
jgi:hypothetical protein